MKGKLSPHWTDSWLLEQQDNIALQIVKVGKVFMQMSRHRY